MFVVSASHPPINSLTPELTNPLARQMPPENRRSTPQGIELARSQFKRRWPLPSGTRNKMTTANSATEASLACGRSNHTFQPPKGSLRVTQASAVRPNTSITLRSCVCQGPTSGNWTFKTPPRLRVNIMAIAGTNNTTTGSAQRIHWVKLMDCPVASS